MSTSGSPQEARWWEARREEWTEAAAAWCKWSAELAVWLQTGTEAIVEAAQIRSGMQILDVACGLGEPALTLAKLVGSDGHVTATDLMPVMVAGAAENARRKGLTNLTFQQADPESLPFPDERFELVTCRYGIPYFPNVPRALVEIRRVLKPGCRAIFTADSFPEPHLGHAGPFTPLMQRAGHLPEPEPEEPHSFTFAQPERLASALEAAGFREVRAELRPEAARWPGPPEQFWEAFLEFAAPLVRPILEGMTQEERNATRSEVLAILRADYDGRQIPMEGAFVLAWGVR